MNKIGVSLLIGLFFALTLSACSIHIGHSHLVKSEDFFFHLQAPNKDARRNLRFNEDENAISTLPQGVKLTVRDTSHGEKRELTVFNPYDNIEFKYKLNNKERPYGESERQWFASIVPKILRQTGLNKEARILRINNKQGTSELINEIKLIESDSVRADYIAFSIANLSLNEKEKTELIMLATTIESDAELSGLLTAFFGTELTKNKKREVLKLARTIQSDYELSSLLQKAPESYFMQNDVQNSLFELTEFIQSDYELSRFFVLKAKSIVLDQETLPRIVSSLETIKSDYEMNRALKAISTNSAKNLSSQTLIALINLAQREIQSDYELSSFLQSIILVKELDSLLAEAIQLATLNMSSSYEKGQVLVLLTEKLI